MANTNQRTSSININNTLKPPKKESNIYILNKQPFIVKSLNIKKNSMFNKFYEAQKHLSVKKQQENSNAVVWGLDLNMFLASRGEADTFTPVFEYDTATLFNNSGKQLIPPLIGNFKIDTPTALLSFDNIHDSLSDTYVNFNLANTSLISLTEKINTTTSEFTPHVSIVSDKPSLNFGKFELILKKGDQKQKSKVIQQFYEYLNNEIYPNFTKAKQVRPNLKIVLDVDGINEGDLDFVLTQELIDRDVDVDFSTPMNSYSQKYIKPNFVIPANLKGFINLPSSPNTYSNVNFIIAKNLKNVEFDLACCEKNHYINPNLINTILQSVINEPTNKLTFKPERSESQYKNFNFDKFNNAINKLVKQPLSKQDCLTIVNDLYDVTKYSDDTMYQRTVAMTIRTVVEGWVDVTNNKEKAKTSLEELYNVQNNIFSKTKDNISITDELAKLSGVIYTLTTKTQTKTKQR